MEPGERRRALFGALFLGSHPGPLPPGRVIADVLPMSALKFGNPVIFSIDMVADDLLPHLNRIP
jgi:hypothetical protein